MIVNFILFHKIMKDFSCTFISRERVRTPTLSFGAYYPGGTTKEIGST
jgi:hypothetical protein